MVVVAVVAAGMAARPALLLRAQQQLVAVALARAGWACCQARGEQKQSRTPQPEASQLVGLWVGGLLTARWMQSTQVQSSMVKQCEHFMVESGTFADNNWASC